MQRRQKNRRAKRANKIQQRLKIGFIPILRSAFSCKIAKIKGEKSTDKVCKYLEKDKKKRRANGMLNKSKKLRNLTSTYQIKIVKEKRFIKLYSVEGFRKIFQKKNCQRY